VRHKILDILGDLSLIGRPLRGHLIAVKPSHSPTASWPAHQRANAQPLLAARRFSASGPGARARDDGRATRAEYIQDGADARHLAGDEDTAPSLPVLMVTK